MPDRGRFANISAWPQHDALAWRNGLSSRSLLRPGGHARRWRPGTIDKVARGYACWLNFLEKQHLLDDGPPGERCTPERLDVYRAYLAETVSAVTVGLLLTSLERALSVIVPTNKFKFIAEIAQTYPKKGDPVEKRRRLEHPAVLQRLGFELMDAAGTGIAPTRRDAVKFRDGLIIALLTFRPMRLRNLAHIQIDRHLRQSGGRWFLDYPGSETKNHKALLAVWPDILVPHLERYLAVYRPLLLDCRAETDELWISQRPGAMTAGGIYDAIVSRTRKAFGKGVNPHLFRDAAVTAIAIDDPKNIALSAHVLNNGFEITQQHYNQAKCIDAARHYHAGLSRIKSTARRARSR